MHENKSVNPKIALTQCALTQFNTVTKYSNSPQGKKGDKMAMVCYACLLAPFTTAVHPLLMLLMALFTCLKLWFVV